MVATQVVRSVAFQLGSSARDERERARIGRIAQKGVHGIRYLGLALGRLDFRHAGEVRTIGVGELHREVESTDSVKRRREVIDRVVLHRPRTVSARVRHLQPEVLRKLLARLDVERDPLPLAIEFPGGALIERETRRR